MIGNFDDLTGPHGGASSLGTTIPSFTLNLPLPLFYTRDSGVALPTAALPYNDMRINFSFRDWTDLLIVDDLTLVGTGVEYSKCATTTDLTNIPTVTNSQVWANYAIVSNDERKRMACAPRDILIEQVQTAPHQTFNPSRDASPSYDIRFSHAIKVLFFGVRNTTQKCQWSNYTAATPVPSSSMVDFSPDGAVDPILQTSLIYENTQRLAQMGSDYFSLVNPWYHAPVIPVETGYHMYSYSLDFICLDPMGSTNYGKLTNVSVVPEASPGSVAASAGTVPNAGGGTIPSGADYPQFFEFITTAVNNNIIRISGGALGFPVL